MGGDDPAAGGFVANCGHKADEECGLKNPEECMVHGPQAGEDKAIAAAVARAMAPTLALIERMLGVRAMDDGDDDGPLPKALEHMKAAQVCCESMPDPDDDADGHDECLRALHAHVKAADAYLDQYRSIRMQAPAAGDVATTDDDKAARAARIAELAPAA
jgi:hypothetical protein